MPYWKVLAECHDGVSLTLVTQEALSENLKLQGWQNEMPSNLNFSIIIAPSHSKIEEILNHDLNNSVHIFSGIRAFPMVFEAFKTSLQIPSVNRVLLTETINLNGFRAITRRLASVFIERKYLRHYDLVLGSGASTRQWYLECGLQEEQFYPFMYAVKSPNTLKKIETADDTVRRFVFIGQLIDRKGLDILLIALNKLKNSNWTLDIFGKGEKEEDLEKQSKELNIDDKVFFNGVLKNQDLQEKLGNYHTLILPSRFDGWGAVINEAIASGLYVISSNKCGASILLQDDGIGEIYKNASHLVKILEKNISDSGFIDRDYILEYSAYLKGEKVADYLLNILDYRYKSSNKKPLPPWERFESSLKK